MGVADYSRATIEEREQVIEVLERNLKKLLKDPRVKSPHMLQDKASEFARRIRNGEVIVGRDFETLVSLLRGRVPPGLLRVR